MVRALIRFLLALGGAAFGAFLVGTLEARMVAAAALEAGIAAAPAPFAVTLVDLGILFPVVVAIAFGVATASIVLEPEEPKTPSAHLAELRGGPLIARLRTAAAAPLVVFATFAWCVGSAHAGRAALASGKPVEAGLTLGIASVTLLLFTIAIATALMPLTRRFLALGSGVVPQLLDPVLTGGAALALVVFLFALGVARGDTSGNGGILGIFGVLKREELDLRPVANALVVALGAYAGIVMLGRGRVASTTGRARYGSIGAAATALGSALVVAGLCGRASKVMDLDPSLSNAVEKHAPLGKISLALLRRMGDHDHDGFAAHYGGGDCVDHDARINPGAIDVPGNGIDEDCSGADTPLPEEPPPSPAEVARAARKRKTYNLVLFTVDTLRTDLGFLGYDKPVSPNLDKLAEKSTVFERAYSMASYTGKSVGPMMIGRYPSETHRDGGHFNTYYPQNRFVAERVHDGAHVRTFAGHCHWYFRFPTGLNQGFDAWDASAIPPGMGDNDTTVTSERMSDLALKMLAKPENTSPGRGDAPSSATALSAAVLDAGAEAGLANPTVVESVDAGTGERHFFAWFHFFDPHAQYVPHEGAPSFTGPMPAKNLYDQEVWFTDKHIGKVLDYIASQPWGEDTAIVVTADHGEAFADHGMSWHGMEIWESLVRVPLLVYLPGVAPRRVGVKRSHIDVAPTLLEILGGPPAEEGELRGKSLLDDVFLPEGEEHEERDVFVDMPAGPYNGIRRAVITGKTPGMKLINSGGASYQLYDLANDPQEKRDLASDKEKLAPVVARLQAIRARLKEVDVKPSAP